MSPTCLVVEDQALVSLTLQEYMTDLGWQVLSASEAEAATEILLNRSDISLLLTDILMPGRNGVDFALEVTRRRPDLKVIFATGCVLEDLEKARSTGFPVITKPFDLQTLSAAVSRLRSP